MYCPLTGQKCDKAKNTHLSDVVDGQVNHMFICKDCACRLEEITGGIAIEPPMPPPSHESEEDHPAAMFSLPLAKEPVGGPIGFFMQLLNQLEQQHREQEVMQVPCPTCGQTLLDVVNTGKIGCPGCYQFFKHHLSPLIQKVQAGNLQHVGKKPKPRHDPKKFIKDSLESLKRKMDHAVGEERYEDAAVIRDQMAILAKKLEFEEES